MRKYNYTVYANYFSLTVVGRISVSLHIRKFEHFNDCPPHKGGEKNFFRKANSPPGAFSVPPNTKPASNPKDKKELKPALSCMTSKQRWEMAGAPCRKQAAMFDLVTYSQKHREKGGR